MDGKLEIDDNETYEVKLYNVVIEKEDILLDLSEDSIQFVKKKIKHYKNKIDSEYVLREYAMKVSNDNKVKSRGYFITAIVIAAIEVFIYLGANLGQYISIYSFSIGDLGSIGALLIYPSFIMFAIFLIICIVKAAKLKKDANIMVDPHSMKYKKIDYALEESKARSKIYEEEVERLEILVRNMKKDKDEN